MPRIEYVQMERGFRAATLKVIAQANEICADYRRQGYDLTLRQLYYQFVSRDLIPNTPKEYDRLGSIINDARLAGLLDWTYITDRTRNLQARGTWDEPAQIVRGAARGYHTDLWANQSNRLEVWIEKDALIGVIAGVCNANSVPYFSCRGYTSQSEVWAAAQRLGDYIAAGQTPVIVHLGDHDPSGIDMSRDIEARLRMFLEGDGRDPEALEVRRIALNYDQVQRYNPPPNPAKLTDSRADGYIARHGMSSWELDALEPTVIGALIRDEIADYRDDEQWETDNAALEEERKILTAMADRYQDVVSFLSQA